MGRGQQTLAADHFSSVFGNKRGHKDHDLDRYVGEVGAEVWDTAHVVMDSLFGNHYSHPDLNLGLIRGAAEDRFRREVKSGGGSLPDGEKASLARQAIIGAFAGELARIVRLSGSPVVVKKIVGAGGYGRWMQCQADLAPEGDVGMDVLAGRISEMMSEDVIGKVLCEARAMNLSEKRPVNRTDVAYLRRLAADAGLQEARRMKAA